MPSRWRRKTARRRRACRRDSVIMGEPPRSGGPEKWNAAVDFLPGAGGVDVDGPAADVLAAAPRAARAAAGEVGARVGPGERPAWFVRHGRFAPKAVEVVSAPIVSRAAPTRPE